MASPDPTKAADENVDELGNENISYLPNSSIQPINTQADFSDDDTETEAEGSNVRAFPLCGQYRSIVNNVLMIL
jgi:hypothetical protein